MLATWLALGNSTCPATGQTLPQPVTVVPNMELRRSIEEWCATHVPWILVSNSEFVQLCSRWSHLFSCTKHVGGWSLFLKSVGSGMQDKEGHLKPIEAENDDLKATQTSRSALIAPLDDDLTLAISLQEDELEQYSARSALPQQVLHCRGRCFAAIIDVA